MRVIADEMISHHIVRIISDTILRPEWQFDSVYHAKLRGRADEDWIMSFARSEGNAIISADQKMLKRETLLQAISDTGLIGIYLPSTFAGARKDEQIAYFSHWWRKIEAKIEEASLGTAWVVPRGLGGGELREHKVTRNVKSKAARSGG